MTNNPENDTAPPAPASFTRIYIFCGAAIVVGAGLGGVGIAEGNSKGYAVGTLGFIGALCGVTLLVRGYFATVVVNQRDRSLSATWP